MGSSNAGEYDLPPSSGHNDYMASMKDFDQSHEILSDVAFDFARLPSDHRLNTFITTCSYAGLAFQIAISTILEDEERNSEEKAKAVVTLYDEADERRVDIFNALDPDTFFIKNHDSLEGLENDIQTQLDAEVDIDAIVEAFTKLYAKKFSQDASQFATSIRSTKRAKALQLAKKAGVQMAETGKIAVGVAIGTVVAREALKRFED